MIVFHIYELFTYMNRGGSQGVRIIEGLLYCYTVCLTILVHAGNEWTGQGIQETMYVFLTWRLTTMQTAVFMCIMWPTNVVAT